jgi:carboxyl-terminal processing protease
MSGNNKWKQASLIGLGLVLGVTLSLNFSASAEKRTTLLPLPYEDMRVFSDVFNKIKTDYVEPVEDKKLLKEAINGMLAGLDPHSAYLDKDAYRNLNESMEGQFEGLGIQVDMDETGFVKVVSPIEGTPAARAGIKPGDYIIKLDDTAVKGLKLDEAVKKMRGPRGTSITLTIMRKTETKPLIITLTREPIKTQSVTSKQLEPGFASVKVSQFQKPTGPDLANALEEVYKKNPNGLKGLVLDLRNDPGGLLPTAIGVSAAFLPDNALVVSSDGQVEDAKVKYFANKKYYLPGFTTDYLKRIPAAVKTVPMVVLVNNGSASASEIVAGALQDHKRAVVIGTQTFGKGSVQTIVPLNDETAIKLTTARYFTPNGRSIQAKGITPDYLVEDANARTGLMREADLERHLSNPTDKEVKLDPVAEAAAKAIRLEAAKAEAAKAVEAAKIEPEKNPDGTDKEKPDVQMEQAMNYLKGLPVMATASVKTSNLAK